MKVCVIFRGDNVREAAHARKYIDVLMCWDNLKKTIYDDLTNNGHECDIVFITYCSKIVEDIKNIIAPTHIEIKERINQSENFKNVLSIMNKYKNTYDRFVILRCDFMYRINITTWPKWDKNGIKEEECNYKKEKKHGLYKEWYLNGQKRKECTFKKGKKHGLYQEWYQNGQKRKECIYINWVLNGEYKEWSEEGELFCHKIYKNGELIETIL